MTKENSQRIAAVNETRVCTCCQLEKPIERFGKRTRYPDGIDKRCRECNSESAARTYRKDPTRARANAKRWRLENRDRNRSNQKRWHDQHEKDRTYNICFADMWQAQGGMCAVCGQIMIPGRDKATKPSVDHDHRCCTGRKSCGKCVRALIHDRCNRLIGVAADDIDLLLMAALYLEKYK